MNLSPTAQSILGALGLFAVIAFVVWCISGMVAITEQGQRLREPKPEPTTTTVIETIGDTIILPTPAVPTPEPVSAVQPESVAIDAPPASQTAKPQWQRNAKGEWYWWDGTKHVGPYREQRKRGLFRW